MLSLLLIVFCFLIKIVFGLVLLLSLLILGFRLCVHPIKGVCKCKTRLDGKVVLITGGNSGIGFETAKDLAKRGARIIIASRDDKKSEEAVEEIKAITGNKNIEYRHLNLALKENIKEFAEKFNKDYDRLDILVNNAGMARGKVNNNGVDIIMQINYIGPFMLTQLLLDKLKTSKPSRIVIVSSYAHAYAKFKVEDLTICKIENTWVRYSNTKLCGILWTRELAKRLPEGVTANVMHPGLVKTNIFNKLKPWIKWFIMLVIYVYNYKTPIEGAQTVIHLCVSPKLENVSGEYYVDCKKHDPAKIAQDDKFARELWDKTMNLIQN